MTKIEKKESHEEPNKGSQKSAMKGETVDILTAYVPTLPLIDGEKRSDYEAFHASCLRALQPTDAVETVWLQDFIDNTWEAQRLKKMKFALIQKGRRNAVRRLILEYSNDEISEAEVYVLAQRWSEGNSTASNYVGELIEKYELGEAAVMVRAMENSLPTLERIEKLIGTYNYRRDASLRELEKRRDVIAKRAREFAESQLPEANITEPTMAE